MITTLPRCEECPKLEKRIEALIVERRVDHLYFKDFLHQINKLQSELEYAKRNKMVNTWPRWLALLALWVGSLFLMIKFLGG